MLNCYSSIANLPIGNWIQILESGNYSFLILNEEKTYHLERPVPSGRAAIVLEKQWRKIYNQHIERFGFSKEFMQVLEHKRKIGKLIAKKILQKDTGAQLFIDIERIKLSELMNEQHDRPKFEQVALTVKKYLGYDMNMRLTTVLEFYAAIELIQKQWQTKKSR